MSIACCTEIKSGKSTNTAVWCAPYIFILDIFTDKPIWILSSGKNVMELRSSLRDLFNSWFATVINAIEEKKNIETASKYFLLILVFVFIPMPHPFENLRVLDFIVINHKNVHFLGYSIPITNHKHFLLVKCRCNLVCRRK